MEKSNWRYKKKLGGGSLLDLGCYPISSFLNLFKFNSKLYYSDLKRNKSLGVDISGSALFINKHALFNLNWGFENRTCGFRVPNYNSANQARIENRLCGSDVNPYLAIAATLSAGYLGIKKKLKATPETKKAAYNVNVSLTESIYQSIDTFSRSKEAKEIFGETFIELFCSIKDLEVNAYNKIITAWEREYLLLNV